MGKATVHDKGFFRSVIQYTVYKNQILSQIHALQEPRQASQSPTLNIIEYIENKAVQLSTYRIE